MTIDTEQLREAAQKATPGPWRWELNEKHKDVQLSGGKPTFDKTVMDFVRYGMGGAAPRFNMELCSDYCIMERAEKFGVSVDGREHHSDWFKSIAHPDAEWIAAANPQAILALLDELDRLREQCRQHEAFQQFANATEQQRLNDARRDGWLAAQNQAAIECKEQKLFLMMQANESLAAKDDGKVIGADQCLTLIRAMQPPAEWASCEQCAAAPNVPDHDRPA